MPGNIFSLQFCTKNQFLASTNILTLENIGIVKHWNWSMQGKLQNYDTLDLIGVKAKVCTFNLMPNVKTLIFRCVNLSMLLLSHAFEKEYLFQILQLSPPMLFFAIRYALEARSRAIIWQLGF